MSARRIEATGSTPHCWCGNANLTRFSQSYLKCESCDTLVLTSMPSSAITRVTDDESHFYGREYWFAHQEQDLGCPNIMARVRTDLPERCLYWLRALLTYRLPPGRILELGAAHGGFVALLRWAGFDASGIELSPWVTAFARRTFDVPMLVGPVEDLSLEPESFDAVILMDVLEHLPYPLDTLRRCVDLLSPQGIVLVQTPCLPEGASAATLTTDRHAFSEMLTPEHLFLFSQRAMRAALAQLGCTHLTFLPAIFGQYDMFAVASRAPLTTYASDAIYAALSATPSGRLAQALLDLDDQLRSLKAGYAESEADRAALLNIIQQRDLRISELEAQLQALPPRSATASTNSPALAEAASRAWRAVRSRLQRGGQLMAKYGSANRRAAAAAPASSSRDFTGSYERIRAPKRDAGVTYSAGTVERIVERLRGLNVSIRDYEINVPEYREYLRDARYLQEAPTYYAFNRAEKSLEHFVAATLLELQRGDVYIDIASEHSPAPEIYRRLFGVEAYRQDIAYPDGFHGDTIGSDAAQLPLPDGFATKMALHCSFEHFEGVSDIRFVREAARVLRGGGAVCIVPLYLFEEYAIQTDPVVAVQEGVAFEDDATVYCAKDWNNRHGRFYDPEHLVSRLGDNRRAFAIQIYRLLNVQAVDPSCYAQFAMVLRKPETDGM